jgi:hypothetical protein
MQLMHAGAKQGYVWDKSCSSLNMEPSPLIRMIYLQAQEGSVGEQTTQSFEGRGEPGQSGGRYEAPTIQIQTCQRRIAKKIRAHAMKRRRKLFPCGYQRLATETETLVTSKRVHHPGRQATRGE